MVAVTTPDLSEAATQLLERAGADRERPATVAVAAARVCEQLAGCLADFVGQSGARAMFDRSLALTARDHPWLADAVAPKGEPAWARLTACLEAHGPAAFQVSIALVATFVGLFSTFVGTGLAFRILSKPWPDVFRVDVFEGTA